MTDFASIFERMANGKSLRSICAEDGLAESTIRNQITADADLAAHYARARDAQADHYAEKIVDVGSAATNESYQKDRLHIDALKWAASKMAPKKYGEKVQLGGDEDGVPIRHEVSWLPPSE